MDPSGNEVTGLRRVEILCGVAILAGGLCLYQASAAGAAVPGADVWKNAWHEPGHEGDFPFIMLNAGDEAVLAAPVADFAWALAGIHVEPTNLHALTNGAMSPSQEVEAELRDLAEALKKADTPESESARILAEHRTALETLRNYVEGQKTAAPPAAFPNLRPARGLPEEFADFFEGAVEAANPSGTNQDAARESWREVLDLPAPQRHYESIRAAFRLGQSWQTEQPSRAITFFKRAHDLSERGFADSPGLAVASLGLEARAQLQLGNHVEAISLCLQQIAAGDATAQDTMRLIAATTVNKTDPAELTALAGDTTVRRVITAWLISTNSVTEFPEKNAAARTWLAAVAASGRRDTSMAEEFSLAAYQAGDLVQTQQWINEAPDAPVNEWLQARLGLREGRVDQAGAALEKLSALFAQEPAGPGGTPQTIRFLEMQGPNFLRHTIAVSNEIRGELGVVQLARQQYGKALDAFLQSGFWPDAAYVAERVLTVDALKDYVDHDWPAPAVEAPENPASRIRWLLARRLVRLQRFGDARPYFPAPLQIEEDALSKSMAKGADAASSDEDRAAALFAAARMMENNGEELSGTEMVPGWFANGAAFWVGNIVESRTNSSILRASEDELRRAGESAPDPDNQFSYRFAAAALAWQAALLMPDNTDDTARVLCLGGAWIKYLDPQKADVFYKALVRRCRVTALGKEADSLRWFPLVDDDGNLIPDHPPPVK